eukprot:228446_1
MTFGLGVLSEVSIIGAIDGVGCHSDESTLGMWGLIIWILLAVYLMVGQFVLCEEFFVPILAQLGDRWKMAEDVQGATLLAVGSSSPELLTALLGVIFYPDDNPGPGTNVCSAVFNLCIIVGLSGIASPRTAKLQIIPFLRDSTTTVTHTMYNANNHSYYHGHPHTQSPTSYHTQQLPSHSYGNVTTYGSNSVPNS